MKTYDLVCVVPVYNEEKILPKAIPLLLRFLQDAGARGPLKVVIADNASIDSTARVSQLLLKKHPKVLAYEYIDKKGRGNALRSVFGQYKARKYLFIDADLPCEPQDIRRLIDGLEAGNDIVACRRTGSRPLLRRIMTVGLRYINFVVFGMFFSDAQCSVKALSPRAAVLLRDSCLQDGWYLDTELLAFAHSRKLRMSEVPITWIETRFPGRVSKVSPIHDIVHGIRALVAIKRAIQRSR